MVKEVYVNAQKKKIPENWSIKTIGDVCEYMAGSTFPKNEQGNEKGDIPFYKVINLENIWGKQIITFLKKQQMI